MFPKHPSKIATKTYPDWDSNINALLRLAHGSTTKASSKLAADSFKPNIYYISSKRPSGQDPSVRPPSEPHTKPLLTRRSSQVSQPVTDRFDPQIEEIKDVIQKLAVHINKLELQQESSSDCTVKRLAELQAIIARSNQATSPGSNVTEADTRALRGEIRGLDQRYNEEIKELQTALGYIKDQLLKRLSGLESINLQSTKQFESTVASVHDSFKLFQAESEDRFLKLEAAISEIATMKYTDIVDNVTKTIQDQFAGMIEAALKGGILEYARKKEDEDYRRLCLIDQRLTELEGSTTESTKSIEMLKLDAKVVGKKDAMTVAKLKEMEENLAGILAEQQAMKSKGETEEASRKAAMEEYWGRVENGIKGIHQNYDAEIAIVKAKVGRSEAEFDEIKTELNKQKDLLNEKAAITADEIAKIGKKTSTDLEALRQKLADLPKIKADLDDLTRNFEKMASQLQSLEEAREETVESIKNTNTALKTLEESLKTEVARIEDLLAKSTEHLNSQIDSVQSTLETKLAEEHTAWTEAYSKLQESAKSQPPKEVMSFAEPEAKPAEIEPPELDKNPSTPTLKGESQPEAEKLQEENQMPTPFITPDEGGEQMEGTMKTVPENDPRARLTFSVSPDPVTAEKVVLEADAKPIEEIPDVAEPETAEQKEAEPEIAEPEIAEPEIAEPEIAEPEIAEPEIAEPETAEHKEVEPEKDKLNDSDGLDDLFPKDLSDVKKGDTKVVETAAEQPTMFGQSIAQKM